MLFNSTGFLVFFPVTVLVYFALPHRVRYLWLLAASYFFYMCWNAKYALLILFSTAVTYLSGILLERADEQRKKKAILALSLIANLAVLFFFKYFNFAARTLESLMGLFGVKLCAARTDVLLPVGISFYTFQALGYSIDVYRGDTAAERNFFRYALFVSFFPQLVAGPIERSGSLLRQLSEEKRFDFDQAREGLLLMLWGYFLKIVLADRIAIFVDRVYNNIWDYPGWFAAAATALFAVQIYCDFGGYSVIAMGAAKVLGIDLMENFSAPYLSKNVAQFWRNWHISLTSWFRDYLYIPLGGSRKGKLRKHLNRMTVFLVSGLWHGADASFIIWGGLNGLYQTVGELLMPARDAAAKALHIRRQSFCHTLLQGIITFVLVDFAWIFFRAQSVSAAAEVIKAMFSVNNIWVLFDGSLYTCGLDRKNFNLMLICIGVLLASDICKKRGIVLRNVIVQQSCWARYAVIALSVAAILTFGIWGSNYSAAGFIYFQF